MNKYKSLPIYLYGDASETQWYVVEAHVTQKQVLSGDDSGVVCLCLMPEMVDTIVDRLNDGISAPHETYHQEANT